jgi:hypothetical protein
MGRIHRWERLEENVHPNQVLVPYRKRRNNTLPILVFLLATAYGLMAFVLMQQGNVIQSQKYLIEQLLDDSKQLTNLRAENAKRNQAAELARKKNAPQSSGKSKTSKPKQQVERPPMQAVDKADARRSAVKI